MKERGERRRTKKKVKSREEVRNREIEKRTHTSQKRVNSGPSVTK